MDNYFLKLTASIFLVQLFSPLYTYAANLPPLGQRQYQVDTEDPFKPVKIAKDMKIDKKHKIMRDPSLRNKPLAKGASEAPNRVKKKVRSGRIRFKTVKISGELTNPRVSFEPEKIPIQRTDSPIEIDTFPKIFEPLKDANF